MYHPCLSGSGNYFWDENKVITHFLPVMANWRRIGMARQLRIDASLHISALLWCLLLMINAKWTKFFFCMDSVVIQQEVLHQPETDVPFRRPQQSSSCRKHAHKKKAKINLGTYSTCQDHFYWLILYILHFFFTFLF